MLKAFLCFLLICLPFVVVFGRFLERQLTPFVPLIPLVGSLIIALLVLTQKPHTRKQLISLILIPVGYLLASALVILPVEHLHFYKYVVLTLLLFLLQRTNPLVRSGLIAATIAIAEESSQQFVPNRFFDLRDILMNLVAVAFGILLCTCQPKN